MYGSRLGTYVSNDIKEFHSFDVFRKEIYVGIVFVTSDELNNKREFHLL